MADLERRRALAEFLRSRRARITPEDVGIPGGSRRRTPGLRREEVAQLSGVSVTWYTWLEQARDITVSRQVLESLSRALQLNRDERRHLYALADEPLLEHPCPAVVPTPALQKLVDALDPHPAYLSDANWDLVAWNRSMAGLIGDPGRLPAAERNLIRLTFGDPGMRTLMADWAGQAQSLLAQFRADSRQRIGDPYLDRITGELRETSPEFRDWWDKHDIAEFHSTQREFLHPELGSLTFDYVMLEALESPGMKLFTSMPSDSATTAKLPALQEYGTRHSLAVPLS